MLNDAAITTAEFGPEADGFLLPEGDGKYAWGEIALAAGFCAAAAVLVAIFFLF